MFFCPPPRDRSQLIRPVQFVLTPPSIPTKKNSDNQSYNEKRCVQSISKEINTAIAKSQRNQSKYQTGLAKTSSHTNRSSTKDSKLSDALKSVSSAKLKAKSAAKSNTSLASSSTTIKINYEKNVASKSSPVASGQQVNRLSSETPRVSHSKSFQVSNEKKIPISAKNRVTVRREKSPKSTNNSIKPSIEKKCKLSTNKVSAHKNDTAYSKNKPGCERSTLKNFSKTKLDEVNQVVHATDLKIKRHDGDIKESRHKPQLNEAPNAGIQKFKKKFQEKPANKKTINAKDSHVLFSQKSHLSRSCGENNRDTVNNCDHFKDILENNRRAINEKSRIISSKKKCNSSKLAFGVSEKEPIKIPKTECKTTVESNQERKNRPVSDNDMIKNQSLSVNKTFSAERNSQSAKTCIAFDAKLESIKKRFAPQSETDERKSRKKFTLKSFVKREKTKNCDKIHCVDSKQPSDNQKVEQELQDKCYEMKIDLSKTDKFIEKTLDNLQYNTPNTLEISENFIKVKELFSQSDTVDSNKNQLHYRNRNAVNQYLDIHKRKISDPYGFDCNVSNKRQRKSLSDQLKKENTLISSFRSDSSREWFNIDSGLSVRSEDNLSCRNTNSLELQLAKCRYDFGNFSWIAPANTSVDVSFRVSSPRSPPSFRSGMTDSPKDLMKKSVEIIREYTQSPPDLVKGLDSKILITPSKSLSPPNSEKTFYAGLDDSFHHVDNRNSIQSNMINVEPNNFENENMEHVQLEKNNLERLSINEIKSNSSSTESSESSDCSSDSDDNSSDSSSFSADVENDCNNQQSSESQNRAWLNNTPQSLGANNHLHMNETPESDTKSADSWTSDLGDCQPQFSDRELYGSVSMIPTTLPAVNITPAERDLSIFTTEYLAELQQLQERIMTSTDYRELERVFALVAETGSYVDSNNYYDFDLCVLDRQVIKKLQRCLLMA